MRSSSRIFEFFQKFSEPSSKLVEGNFENPGDVFSRDKNKYFLEQFPKQSFIFSAKTIFYTIFLPPDKWIGNLATLTKTFRQKYKKQFARDSTSNIGLFFSLKKACFFKNNARTCRIHYWQRAKTSSEKSPKRSPTKTL